MNHNTAMDRIVVEQGVTLGSALEMTVRNNPNLLHDILTAPPEYADRVVNLNLTISFGCTNAEAREHLEALGYRPAVLP